MDLDEIEEIRYQIICNLIKTYPDMPINNMFRIDVEETKYEMQLDKSDYEH